MQRVKRKLRSLGVDRRRSRRYSSWQVMGRSEGGERDRGGQRVGRRREGGGGWWGGGDLS